MEKRKREHRERFYSIGNVKKKQKNRLKHPLFQSANSQKVRKLVKIGTLFRKSRRMIC